MTKSQKMSEPVDSSPSKIGSDTKLNENDEAASPVSPKQNKFHSIGRTIQGMQPRKTSDKV